MGLEVLMLKHLKMANTNMKIHKSVGLVKHGWTPVKIAKYVKIMVMHHGWKKAFAPCGLTFITDDHFHVYDMNFDPIDSLTH